MVISLDEAAAALLPVLLHRHTPSVVAKVRVHVEDVGLLDVEKGWGDVSHAAVSACAHDVAETSVEQLGCHDEAVSLTIVQDEVENGSCGHGSLGAWGGVYPGRYYIV
jgi:hypothetical protein